MTTLLAGAEKLLVHPESGAPLDDDTGRRELYLPFGAGATFFAIGFTTKRS